MFDYPLKIFLKKYSTPLWFCRITTRSSLNVLDHTMLFYLSFAFLDGQYTAFYIECCIQDEKKIITSKRIKKKKIGNSIFFLFLFYLCHNGFYHPGCPPIIHTIHDLNDSYSHFVYAYIFNKRFIYFKYSYGNFHTAFLPFQFLLFQQNYQNTPV